MEERGKRKTGEKEEEPHTQEERLTSPSPYSLFALFPRKLRPILAFLVLYERERRRKSVRRREAERTRMSEEWILFSMPHCHGTVIQIADEGYPSDLTEVLSIKLWRYWLEYHYKHFPMTSILLLGRESYVITHHSEYFNPQSLFVAWNAANLEYLLFQRYDAVLLDPNFFEEPEE